MGKILEKLELKCVEDGFFEKSSLKDIDDSECKIPLVEVIDFDKVKRKVYAILNASKIKFNEPMSCDCMKISPMASRIDFIEIKGLKTYIQEFKAKERKVNSVDKQINKFGLKYKYIDSLTVLHTLLQIGKLELKKIDTQHIKNIIPFYIIVTDIDLENDGMARFLLAIKHRESECLNIEGEIGIKINSCINEIDNIPKEKKLLIYEGRLDEYYNKS